MDGLASAFGTTLACFSSIFIYFGSSSVANQRDLISCIYPGVQQQHYDIFIQFPLIRDKRTTSPSRPSSPSVPFQLVLSAISILQHSYRPPTLTRFYSEIYLPFGSVEDPQHLLARSTVLPEHPGNRVSYSCELYPTVDEL